MPAGISSPRQARTRYRHELRTLTYVTLDQTNGGVVRNLTRDGIGVQALTPLRPRQQVDVRLELRYPRLHVETRGEVVWSSFSGQCGIRFVNLPQRATRQINEWIFGSLLETAWATMSHEESSDGLTISPAISRVIELPLRHDPPESASRPDPAHSSGTLEFDWLSQPLSPRSLAWIVNTLIVASAVLLFALVFLAITREPPRWPYALASGAGVVVFALYWGFFKTFGGSSLGARLAHLKESIEEEENSATRFR